MTPACPYCQATPVLVTGAVIYPRRFDLYGKKFYKCLRCTDVYVGCHPGTDEPLGRLADAQLRRAKQRAHAAFDPLWRAAGKGRRSAAYAWLARELAMDPACVHIGMMDADLCERVVELCQLAANTRDFKFSMKLT